MTTGYTLTKSDGTTLATIAPGGVNTTATNLTLPGPNYVGYGQALNENLVYLLENFASDSAPTGVNLPGQLWFDTEHQTLNVFTDAGYSPVSGITVSSSMPALQKDGDIWYSTSTNQMYMSSGGNFVLVGPVYTKAQGVSGAIPATVIDASSSSLVHNILQLQFGNTVFATFSTDLPFVPSGNISGDITYASQFPVINPGITLNQNIGSASFNSNIVGSLTGTVHGSLVGNVIATTLSGTLTGNVVGNVTGTSIVASTVTGSLTGDVTSTNGRITNLTSSNVSLTSGNVTGLSNLSATRSTLTTITAGTISTANLSVSNLVVSGGSISGLSALNVGTLQTTNFSSSNVVATGGYLNNLTNVSATTASLTNVTTSNLWATGGSLTNMGVLGVAFAQATNLSTGNAVISGGYISGVANVLVNGGNISNTNGTNNTLTGATLVNPTATTKTYSDSSTAVATTAFVQSVLPRGAIIMWGGSLVSIPAGWQLCDGSNSTPDLRDKFIIGAGLSYTPTTTGGNSSVTLSTNNMPAHVHAVNLSGATDQAGAHNHSLIDNGHTHSYSTPHTVNAGGGFGYGTLNADSGASTTGSSTTGITVAQAATHSHTMTVVGNTSSVGSGQSFSTLPPYYALCYIQKMY
jgi:hypothetical protein